MSLIDRKEFIYRALSLLLLFACVTVAFLTIDDYGMGWDEPTRWNSGDLKVDYYKELVSSEDPLSVVQSVESEDYPGFFDMTLSILHRLTAWDRFALGHWQAFLFGLSGLAALWRIGFIFGGARLGFWSVALMLITPVFYGHWFHNPKDVPFAAMYTIGLLALIELFRDVSRVRKRWLLAASVACGLCMATRVAGMVLLAYAAGALVVLVLSELWHEREEIDLRGLLCRRISWVLSLFVLGVGAYLILMVFWPSSHKNLLSSSGATLQQLHVRASEIPLFFRGEIMWAADAPHYYTLWMFGIKAPEVLLLGLLLAVALTAVHFRARLQSIISPGRVPCLSLLILGSFFPLAYLTLTGPALHNGARHFLFAFPALAVCAAWAYLETADWIGLHRPRLVPLARLVFAFLILLPVSYLIRLHPYQYVYFNALSGGPSGAYGSYETEYWFTSSKHAVETLDTLRRSGALVMPEGRAARVFILGPWQVAEPFLPESYELTGDPNEADFHILNTQMMVHQSFHGDTLFVIERLGVPICVVNAATTQ